MVAEGAKEINVSDYIRYAIATGLVRYLPWYYSLFAMVNQPTDIVITETIDSLSKNNKFVKYDKIKNEVYVNIHGHTLTDRYTEPWKLTYKTPLDDLIDITTVPIGKPSMLWVKLAGGTADKPPLDLTTRIQVHKDIMPNLDEKDEKITDIGRAICNHMLFVIPFGNKFKYMETMIDIQKLDGDMASGLLNGDISVSEYRKYAKYVTFLMQTARLFVISGNKDFVLPPPGLEEFRTKLSDEYDAKYKDVGGWHTNRVAIAKYEEELKNYHLNYLKDNPAWGLALSNKLVNNSMGKIYRTFGAEAGFDTKGESVNFVKQPLVHGWPKDPRAIVAIANSIFAGSYLRGFETQKGGAAAKDTLRAISSKIISSEDCKTPFGEHVAITALNASNYISLYYMEGNTATLITTKNVNELIGRTLLIRTPQYCLEPDGNYCEICAGKALSLFKNGGIALGGLEIGGKVLKSSLKVMHNAGTKTVYADFNKMFR